MSVGNLTTNPWRTPALYMGMRVVESPLLGLIPKIQISPDFKWCSDEFRAETNRWFLEQFGMHDPIYRAGDTMLVSRANMERLRRETNSWSL